MSNADSIKSRLRNIAVAENLSFDYLLMLYMIERLLFRISISEYKESFILKGGLLLYTVLDNAARVTKDVDFLGKGLSVNIKTISEIFNKICAIEANDAIEFDTSSIKAEKIKEDADYEGIRLKITAYIDRSKKVLQFDIGFGDIIIPGPVDLDYPSLLNMESPRLKAYSLESVIAEKFEAMIYLANANSRMKDFYDIFSLSQKCDFKGKTLSAAIKETIVRRNTPVSDSPTVFSKAFAEDKNKAVQWNAFKKRINSKIDLSFYEVIDSIKEFLKPIYDSIIKDEAFVMNWSSKNKWKK